MLGIVLAAANMLDYSGRSERMLLFRACASGNRLLLKALEDGAELKPCNVAKTALAWVDFNTDGDVPDPSGDPDPLGISRLFKNDDRNENVELKEPILNGLMQLRKPIQNH